MIYRTLAHRFALLLLFAGSVTFLTACDSNDPADEGAGEQEIISNVTLTLVGDDGSTITAEATFDEGGVLQNAETITLTPGVTYDGSVELLDTFNGEDITEEIRAEAIEHQFFYDVTGATGVTVTITDEETDYASENELGGEPRSGVPVGLAFEVAVAADASGSGQMNVVLGHYDERPKETDETVANTPERDVDFNYPLTVQ
jgi:hypothetical protein